MGTCPTVVFVARFQLIIVGSQRKSRTSRIVMCRKAPVNNESKKKKKPERATHFLADFCRHRTTQVVKRDRTVMRSSS